MARSKSPLRMTSILSTTTSMAARIAARSSPGTLPVGTAMYCGTLVVLGEIGGGERFDVELVDPVKNRTLRHGYDCHSLAIAD